MATAFCSSGVLVNSLPLAFANEGATEPSISDEISTPVTAILLSTFLESLIVFFSQKKTAPAPLVWVEARPIFLLRLIERRRVRVLAIKLCGSPISSDSEAGNLLARVGFVSI